VPVIEQRLALSAESPAGFTESNDGIRHRGLAANPTIDQANDGNDASQGECACHPIEQRSTRARNRGVAARWFSKCLANGIDQYLDIRVEASVADLNGVPSRKRAKRLR
jgi:hypothetical protein